MNNSEKIESQNQEISKGSLRISKFNVELPQPKSSKPTLAIIIGITAAFVVFLLIWIFYLKKNPIGFLRDDGANDPNEEKSAEMLMNPLTGVRYPQQEAAAWINNRPLAVMVNNHQDARPQSGLIFADLVYEVTAEAGITRFLPFFLAEIPEKIGSVRSARDYYLVLVKELGDAMIMHIGWSPQALEAIETWPVRSLGRGGGTFWRENPRDVAVEHTAFTDGKELMTIADNLGWDGTGELTPWIFKDDQNKYSDKPEAKEVSIDFWDKGDFTAIFKYDQATNTYLRFMGYDEDGNPIPHLDNETQEQIRPSNVIVQFAVETAVFGDDKGRLDYELIGSNTSLIFMDGRVIEATWTKEDRDERTIFYDANGEQIQFNRGKMWICIVPDRNVAQVVYN